MFNIFIDIKILVNLKTIVRLLYWKQHSSEIKYNETIFKFFSIICT